MSCPASRPSASGLALRARLRRLADAAVTPLDLDDVLDVFHPLRSGAELRGRIVSVTAETAESATILIKPGRDWTGHLPGQYVRIGVDVDGVRLWRTYSLTHGPRADRCISITVKAIPDGVVSNYLVHRARAGEMIQLEQAEGEFVLPQPLPRQAAAGHRRLRDHAGDRDAAQPLLAAYALPPRTSCSCTSTSTSRRRSSATSCARWRRPAGSP